MQEKIRLIIIMVLAAMLAVSLFMGQQTYRAKKAIELERNTLINENESLAKKIEEIAKARKQLQEKVNALINNLDKASQEKQDIQEQYELIVKERDELIGELKTLEKNNERLRGDLSNLVREKQQLGESLEDNLSSLRNENARLKGQWNNLNALKSKLETELGQLKGEKSDLEGKLNEIDSFLQRLTEPKYLSLKEQLDALRSSSKAQMQQTAGPEREAVELPPIVVRPQAQVETPTWWPKKSVPINPTGTVLEVNRENRFVVIDLGKDSGAKLGHTLKVYREDAQIATLAIIQVRQSISACDIKEEITAIEVGDIVR